MTKQIKNNITQETLNDYVSLFLLTKEVWLHSGNRLSSYSLKYLKMHFKCWRHVVRCRIKYSDYKIDYLPLFINYYAVFICIVFVIGLDKIIYSFSVSIQFTSTEYTTLFALSINLLYFLIYLPLSRLFFNIYFKRLENILYFFKNNDNKEIQNIFYHNGKIYLIDK